MQEQPVILVQVSDPQWTWTALQSACALARRQGGRIVLLQMVRMQHIAHLGAALDSAPLTPQAICDLQAYAAAAADSGVPCEAQAYQYYDLFGALCEAAAQMGAVAVFAKLPSSALPFWSECRLELLRSAGAGGQVGEQGERVDEMAHGQVEFGLQGNEVHLAVPQQQGLPVGLE